MSDNVKNITSVSDLKNYASGIVCELPPFADGQPFVARLVRPSVLSLAGNGRIPNGVLGVATSLFNGTTSDSVQDSDYLLNMFKTCEIIADAALVEPTYKQIVDAGVSLTDEQFIAIFNFSQSGVKALESFR